LTDINKINACARVLCEVLKVGLILNGVLQTAWNFTILLLL